MNKINLLRMADYAETIPQDRFHMGVYRSGQKINPECDSVGCLIGHCTILDPNPLPYLGGAICFEIWSYRFTELAQFSDKWNWCFHQDWAEVDNTPTGAAARIRYLVEHGLPENWEDQMIGRAPLCYK